MSLGSEARSMVTELITSGDLWTHSATITYGQRRTKANKYSPATNAAAIDPLTLNVAAFPVEKPLEEGGVKIAMWEVYVPAATITVAPTVEDTITIDGVRAEILSVKALGANAIHAAYLIMARR